LKNSRKGFAVSFNAHLVTFFSKCCDQIGYSALKQRLSTRKKHVLNMVAPNLVKDLGNAFFPPPFESVDRVTITAAKVASCESDKRITEPRMAGLSLETVENFGDEKGTALGGLTLGIHSESRYRFIPRL
jgi:hypothetical protein